MTSLAEVQQVLLGLVEKHCGVGQNLSGRHPGWLLSRLERVSASYLRQPPCALGEIGRYVEQHPAELKRLVELVRVGETRLFRDPEQWQALGESLPSLFGGAASVRALSAGCSTGEEAWTLAMLLAQYSPVPFKVHGVDRSEAAIEAARAGCFPEEAAPQLPPAFLRFVERREGSLSVVDGLRPKVSFACVDLLSGPPALRCELLICKNVLIYLRPEVAEVLLRGFASVLVPEGVLVVARAELAAAKAAGFVPQQLAGGVSVLRVGVRS